MYNPTNRWLSVLCQQPRGSSSSEAVKEEQGDETDTLRGHLIYECVCSYRHFACVCASE